MKSPTALFIIFFTTLFLISCGSSSPNQTEDKSVINEDQSFPTVVCPPNTVYMFKVTEEKQEIAHFCLDGQGRFQGPGQINNLNTNTPKLRGHFLNDIQIGQWVMWDDNGKLRAIQNFNENGDKHGWLIIWTEDGNYEMGKYADGWLIDDLSCTFNSESKLLFCSLYDENNKKQSVTIDDPSLAPEVQEIEKNFLQILEDELSKINQ